MTRHQHESVAINCAPSAAPGSRSRPRRTLERGPWRTGVRAPSRASVSMPKLTRRHMHACPNATLTLPSGVWPSWGVTMQQPGRGVRPRRVGGEQA